MLPNAPTKPMPVPGGGAPTPGGAPAPAGGPPAAAVGEEGGASPEQVRAAIMTVLQRAKQLADKYGLDLGEMVASMGGGGGRSVPPPPPTPMG